MPSSKARIALSADWWQPEGKHPLTPRSNMPIKKLNSNREGKSHVEFEETPVMSTYLLVLILMPVRSQMSTTISRFHIFPTGKFHPPAFEKRPSIFGKSIELEVLSYRDDETELKYPLYIAEHTLKYFENLFMVEYPLPKVTMVPIPNFPLGGMENWGCITFCEACLLIDPSKSSANQKKMAVEVIAHEIAHHWFGDLVTMEDWNDLWLNESFATWAAYKAGTKLNVLAWTEFMSDDTFRAMADDHLSTSHPMSIKGLPTKPTAEQIDQFFDSITYQKGASVLRMVEAWLGPDQFASSLGSYLKDFALKNADRHKLWEYLHVDIEPWVVNAGYPIVNYDKDGENPSIALSWAVPYLDHLTKDIEKQTWAYAIFDYPLMLALKRWNNYSVERRVKFINDYHILFERTLLPGINAHTFVVYLLNVERHAVVLNEMIMLLHAIYVIWDRCLMENKKALRSAGGMDITTPIEDIFNNMHKVKGTPEEKKKLEKNVLHIMERLGYDELNEVICNFCTASDALAGSSSDPNKFLQKLDQDNLTVILRILVENQPPEVFDTMLGWIKRRVLEERFRVPIIFALVSTPRESDMDKLLKFVENDCVSTDCFYVLSGLMRQGNRAQRKSWGWFKVNVKSFKEGMGTVNTFWGNMLETYLGDIWQEDLRMELLEFVKEHKDILPDKNVRMALAKSDHVAKLVASERAILKGLKEVPDYK